MDATNILLSKISKCKLYFLIGYILMLCGLQITGSRVSVNFSIDDDTPPGQLIGNIKSSTDSSAERVYSLLHVQNKPTSYFRIDRTTGKLYTNKTIDREEICKDVGQICRVKLRAAVNPIAGGSPWFPDIQIEIFDRNDHIPRFSRGPIQTIEIKESASVNSLHPLPLAEDPDSPKYSIQSYMTEPNLPPELSLRQKYQTLSDGSQYISSVNLEVKERLDREKQDHYTFTLKAIDGGNPKQTGSIEIKVIILDENDNGPTFVNSTYRAQVRESLWTSQPILTLHAKDPDTGINAKVQYNFIKTVDPKVPIHFQLDQESGQLRLKSPLDFETARQYRFQVVASDYLGYESSSTTSVIIDVVDLNDEKPIISVDYLKFDAITKIPLKYTTVKENKNVDEFIAILTVTDKDTGDNGYVVCKLGHGAFDKFVIREDQRGSNEVMYTIMTSGPLDHERTPEIRLTVNCIDKGDSPQATTEILTIRVEDENDHDPQLSLTGKVSIRENMAAYSPVVRVNATDPDSGDNGKIVFSMASPTKPETLNFFRIDSHTGLIQTLAILDRERTDVPTDYFPVIVTATDKGNPKRSSTLSFNIQLLDENDNPPVFKRNPMIMRIMENLPANSYVGEIEIEDRDSFQFDVPSSRLSINQRSQYGIVPFKVVRVHDKFFVNTTRSLDRESEERYTFLVIAVDTDGGLSYTVTGTVSVIVEDENDNSPTIIFPQSNNKTFTLSYRESKYYEMLTINANDRDQGDNTYQLGSENTRGQYFFELKSDMDFLEIDPTAGTIRVRREMKEEDIGRYWVTITVRDTGHQPRESSIQLIVEVTDTKPHSSSSFTELDHRGRPFGGSGSSGGGLWTDDTILVLVLIMVLLLLLGTITLFVYVRYWRGSRDLLFSDQCLTPLVLCCCKNGRRHGDNRNIDEKKNRTVLRCENIVGIGFPNDTGRNTSEIDPMHGKPERSCSMDKRVLYKTCTPNPLDYPHKTMQTLSGRNIGRKSIDYETVGGMTTPDRHHVTRVYHELDLNALKSPQDMGPLGSCTMKNQPSKPVGQQLGYDQLYFSPTATSPGGPSSRPDISSSLGSPVRYTSTPSTSVNRTNYQTLGSSANPGGGIPVVFSKFPLPAVKSNNSSSETSKALAMFRSPLLGRHQHDNNLNTSNSSNLTSNSGLLAHRYNSDSNLSGPNLFEKDGAGRTISTMAGDTNAKNFLMSEQYKVQQKSMYMYSKSFPHTQASYV